MCMIDQEITKIAEGNDKKSKGKWKKRREVLQTLRKGLGDRKYGDEEDLCTKGSF